MKTGLTLLAFAMLTAFLYILVSSVPRLDLMVVVGATLLLAFWDLFFHDRLRLRRSARDMAARDAAQAGVSPLAASMAGAHATARAADGADGGPVDRAGSGTAGGTAGGAAARTERGDRT